MSRVRGQLLVLLPLLLTAAVLSGCRDETATVSRDEAREFRNAPVILISIDTLRSDRLPAYGYKGVETPNLDMLRRESVLFRRAFSNSPMTLPSHASMLTGLLPAAHGLRNNVGYRLDPARTPYLPCILRQNGYNTGAAVSTYVLRAESGLSSCFDLYDDTVGVRGDGAFVEQQRPGDVTAAIAKPWLTAQASKPFFFFFHIYEPHAPYSPVEPFRSRYKDAYSGEVAASDAIVGDFLGYLKSIGVYDRAVIIVTSDHGEGLGDHGESQHSILLYREAIQVPLLIRLPGGLRGGTTIEETAQLTDLTPTILDLLGIESRSESDGASLFRPSNGDRKVFSETLYPRIHLAWNDLASLVDGRLHYIHGPKPELYDLEQDPGETRNLIAERRRDAGRLREATAPMLVPMAPISEVDPEVAKNLASLGYIGSSRADSTSVLPNPRDEIAGLERLRQALELANSNRLDEAIRSMDDLLRQHPSMMEGWNQLGGLHGRAGNHALSAQAYEHAASLAPFPPSDTLIQAGFAHLRAGNFAKAEALATLGMRDVPDKAHSLRARVLLATGKLGESEFEARAAIAARPSSPAAFVLLAETQQKQQRLDEALRSLDEAQRLAETRESGSVYGLDYLRGDTLARAGRPKEAAAAYLREIGAFPHHLEAWGSLCVLQFLQGRSSDVERTLEEMVKVNRTRSAFLYAARTLDSLENPQAAAAWRRRAESIR